MKLIEAIARYEGFFVPGSRPAHNNNPGDIEFGPFAKKNGATGGDPRFAIFPTEEKGWAALRKLLNSKSYLGLTVNQAINKYAPSTENNVHAYIENICAWTGLMPDTVLTSENIG
jgi:hypothetical protein